MAGKSANEFSIDLKKFGKLSREQAQTIFRKIALDLDSRIVYSTPVDTGRARGNWIPSIGSPSSAVNEELYSHTGASTVAVLDGVVASAVLGDIIWMANNLDYIGELEQGSSRQAPQGMVTVNVAATADFYGAL
jgi:hypothetical protein